MFLLENSKSYYEHYPLEVSLKSSIDHSELDRHYFLARAKNAAKTVDEMEKVRLARQELREFEKEIDSMLPSRKKLKKFRKMARSLIEDNNYKSRVEPSSQFMTELERDRFDAKVKEMEAAYPNLDLTTLYESDSADQARQVLHKKAYASYKTFNFLKHGVKTKKEESPKLSKSKQRLLDNDPYNFPELEQTVHGVLSDSITQTELNDRGEAILRPGRRFDNYTQQEYIESYFGKDMARR